MVDRGERKARFGLIPAGLDVLVCHSPAHKVLDWTYDGDYAGCPELRSVLRSRKPKHFCFGHIHEGFRDTGLREEVFEQTVCHNCATYGYGSRFKPVYFEV
jgi:Icc-related predicted phosphoesterase